MAELKFLRTMPFAAIIVVAIAVVVSTALWVDVAGARADESGSAAQILNATHSKAEIETAEETGEESLSVPDPETVEGGGLDRGEALELMEGDFGSYLEGSSGIFDEFSVRRFVNEDTAVLGYQEQQELGYEGKATGSALLESTIPLEADTAVPGILQPVDLSLEHSEGEIQAANPLVEVGIPSELGDGIQIAGAEIHLVGGAGSRVATLSSTDAAFFPEALEDTDLAIAPTPSGVEAFTQLLSAEAPTEETYEVTLPTGAELVALPDGGAKAMEGGQELFFVTPTTAVDADGEPVKTEMTVDGSALSVKVEPSASAAYPIMVDPSVGEDLYNWNGGTENWIGWDSYRAPSTPSYPDTYREPSYGCAYSCFLYVAADPTGWNAASTQVYWNYSVPRFQSDYETYGVFPTTTIGCLTTGTMVFSTLGDTSDSPRAIDALSNNSGAWVNTYMWDRSFTGGFSNCTTGNQAQLAAFGLFATENTLISQTRYLEVGYAQVLLEDTEPPAISKLPEPSHWVNASLNPFEVGATDTGLGVSSLQVSKSNGEAIWTVHAKTTSGANCTGTTRAPCPREWRNEEAGNEVTLNTASLPQGLNILQVAAGDPLGQVVLKSLHLYVDHTKPELSVAGSLLEQNTLGTDLPEYTVAVSANDGAEATPQSGVANVEIKVDGKMKNVEAGWAPGCNSKNCPLVKTWTLKASEYTTGKHTLEVVAHDAVGLASTPSTSTFEITRDTTKPQVIGSGALVEGPKGWIEQGSSAAFHGEIKDPGGSGATLMELKVTGAKAVSKPGACPRGGCTLTENFKVDTAALSGGTHTVTLVGKDAAGNVGEQSWTIYVDPVSVASASETAKTLEAMETTSEAAPIAPPSEVISAEEIAEGNDPSLEREGAALVSEKTPVESSISTESDAIEIETPTGAFVMEPESLPGDEENSPTIENGVAAVSSDSGNSVDTITRPEFDGVMQFATIRSAEAPEEYAYHITKGPHQTLRQVDPLDIGLFYENGEEAVLITAEQAWDAIGHQVESTVAIAGPEEIVMTVHHRATGVVYPVVAGVEPQTGYSVSVSTLTETEPLPPVEGLSEEKEEEAAGDSAWLKGQNGKWGPGLAGLVDVGAPQSTRIVKNARGFVEEHNDSWPFKAPDCWWQPFAEVPAGPLPGHEGESGQCVVSENILYRGWVHGHFSTEAPTFPEKVWWEGTNETTITCEPGYEAFGFKDYPKICHFAGPNMVSGPGSYIIVDDDWRAEEERGVPAPLYEAICHVDRVRLHATGLVGKDRIVGAENRDWGDPCEWKVNL